MIDDELELAWARLLRLVMDMCVLTLTAVGTQSLRCHYYNCVIWVPTTTIGKAPRTHLPSS